MKSFLLVLGLVSFLSAGDVAKMISPSCPTENAVSEFIKIWVSTKDPTTALSAHPECLIITKGAPIKTILESSFSHVKIVWVDLGGHTRIGWVVREAVW